MGGSQKKFGLLAALALSGCAGLGGTFSVDRFLNQEITGDTAHACIARTYQAWARHKAWVQVNYAGAARIAERVQGAASVTQAAGPSLGQFSFCEAADTNRLTRMISRATAMPDRECACAAAVVEAERLSCAGPADDKAALQKRFEAAAAACEGG